MPARLLGGADQGGPPAARLRPRRGGARPRPPPRPRHPRHVPRLSPPSQPQAFAVNTQN